MNQLVQDIAIPVKIIVMMTIVIMKAAIMIDVFLMKAFRENKIGTDAMKVTRVAIIVVTVQVVKDNATVEFLIDVNLVNGIREILMMDQMREVI